MRRGALYLCISEADVLTPRHNNNTAPVMATSRRKRVLVSNTHSALVGGSVALAAFQLIPPFGRSISSFSGGPQHHPGVVDVQLLGRGARRPGSCYVCGATVRMVWRLWLLAVRTRENFPFNRRFDKRKTGDPGTRR
jgi:hypothetical protein